MYKNIIFDLGNVIIDLEFERSEKELIRIFGDDMHTRLAALRQGDIFERYEMGLCSENTFVEVLQMLNTQRVSSRRIIDAWNAMLIQTPMKRLQLLAKLRSQYQVFLLSNTNQTHLDWVYDDLKRSYQITDFESRYFHKAYYSHLIHLRKPQTQIYEYVLADASIKAAETLFIDDNEANIIAAKQVGIHAILHPVGTDICDVIEGYLRFRIYEVRFMNINNS
jgi:glucose-1-phosphatase